MRLTPIIVAVVLFLASPLTGQDAEQQNYDGNTRLMLQVLDERNQEPVADAHVVLRFTEERMLRRDKQVSWEAKTNRKGVLVFSNVPAGTIQLQIIANGFQTYGDQHQLQKPQEEVTIILQPPTDQVSAY
jgi:hypothetical protein